MTLSKLTTIFTEQAERLRNNICIECRVGFDASVLGILAEGLPVVYCPAHTLSPSNIAVTGIELLTVRSWPVVIMIFPCQSVSSVSASPRVPISSGSDWLQAYSKHSNPHDCIITGEKDKRRTSWSQAPKAVALPNPFF